MQASLRFAVLSNDIGYTTFSLHMPLTHRISISVQAVNPTSLRKQTRDLNHAHS